MRQRAEGRCHRVRRIAPADSTSGDFPSDDGIRFPWMMPGPTVAPEGMLEERKTFVYNKDTAACDARKIAPVAMLLRTLSTDVPLA
ncbi:MAG: hypothetical protein IPL61_27380 [Myxococcales bacterium]|nr:hypothetical protein [Myxococcales bacterium]